MVDSQPNLPKVANSKRFGNYLIDIVTYLVICFIFGFVAGVLLAIAGNADFIETPAFNLIVNLFSYSFLFLYYFVCELLWGATLGKLITGTRVTTRKGLKPTAGAIALRTIVRFVPFEPFSFFFGEGWHDKWSKTTVVDVKDRV